MVDDREQDLTLEDEGDSEADVLNAWRFLFIFFTAWSDKCNFSEEVVVIQLRKSWNHCTTLGRI